MTHAKTDPNLLELISALKAESRSSGVGIWRDIALRLEKAKANWAEVNLSKLERYASEGDVIVVPGKVLGSGALSKKVTVAAYGFSESAKMKIEASVWTYADHQSRYYPSPLSHVLDRPLEIVLDIEPLQFIVMLVPECPIKKRKCKPDRLTQCYPHQQRFSDRPRHFQLGIGLNPRH